MQLELSRRTLLGGSAAIGGLVAVGSPSVSAAAAAAQSSQTLAPLSVEALGHLNHFHSIAHQLPGDWSGMGIEAISQGGDDAFHMQLPYMVYVLAVAQHARTPAYRELYRSSINGLIEKMKRNEVWDYWEGLSTGESRFGGDSPLIRTSNADPIKNANVMYSGHIHALMALYESLYRDGRWFKNGSFTLTRVDRRGNRQDFVYDLPKVNDVVLDQFRSSGYLGLECEPDDIFPTTCNDFPLAGFMFYDAARGTNFADEVVPRHIDAWKKISSLYRLDREAQAPNVIRASTKVLGLSDETALGKAQFMNAYVRDYIRAIYPKWRSELFSIDQSGMLAVRGFKPGGLVKVNGEPATISRRERAQLPLGFLGSQEQLSQKVPPSAAEIGDVELLTAALKFADHHNPPVWKNGELYYERVDERGPRFTNRRGAILMASGRIWTKDAFYNLANHPWRKSELNAPQVQAVEYPKVLISQAFHDPSKDALVVTLVPHGSLPSSSLPKHLETQFEVINLDPNAAYDVARDRVKIGSVNQGKSSGPLRSDGPPGTLKLRTNLAGVPQTFTISRVTT